MLTQFGYQAVVEAQSRSIVNHMLCLHTRRLEGDHLLQVYYVIHDLLSRSLLFVCTVFEFDELLNEISMLLVQELGHMLCFIFDKFASFFE